MSPTELTTAIDVLNRVRFNLHNDGKFKESEQVTKKLMELVNRLNK